MLEVEIAQVFTGPFSPISRKRPMPSLSAATIKRVYLDSSDYSRLSDPRTPEAWREETLSLLRQARLDGRADFVFSAATIAEVSPLDRSALDLGVRRLKLVDELCGESCLSFGSDLVRAELLQCPLEGNPRWIPAIGLASRLSDLKSNIVLRATNSPRSIRRLALTKDGQHLRSAAFGRNELIAIASEHPIVSRSLPVLVRYLEGRASLGEACRSMTKDFADVRIMVRLFETRFDDAVKIMKWVREAGPSHLARIDTARRTFEAAAARIGYGRVLQECEEIVESVKKDFYDGSRPEVVALFLRPDETFPPISSSADLMIKSPTYYSQIECFAMLFRSCVLRQKVAANAKQSDVGDIYHAAYIPHVDAFRCDTAMRENFSSVAKSFGTDLLGSLDELMAWLRA